MWFLRAAPPSTVRTPERCFYRAGSCQGPGAKRSRPGSMVCVGIPTLAPVSQCHFSPESVLCAGSRDTEVAWAWEDRQAPFPLQPRVSKDARGQRLPSLSGWQVPQGEGELAEERGSSGLHPAVGETEQRSTSPPSPIPAQQEDSENNEGGEGGAWTRVSLFLWFFSLELLQRKPTSGAKGHHVSSISLSAGAFIHSFSGC